MKFVMKVSSLMLSTALLAAPAIAAEPTSKVVTAEEVQWGLLNPLRGKLSPGAADLWGDRTTDKPTGMLVRFNKGFSSPPHIHNITYRGVVIQGQMHNDDPKAEKMWMPTGSFWTQPAGEDHITAANGDTNLIYLEIDSGPYLVKPSEEKFDNGERPLNLHNDNIVWMQDSDMHNIKAKGVQSTYVWGETDSMNGSMVKIPAGFDGSISTKANEFRAVVISGELDYSSKQRKNANLKAGSYLESTGKFKHQFKNTSQEDAVVYIRTNSPYSVK